MSSSDWLTALSSSLPRYFNLLSGKCTIVLSARIVECSKAILAAQSPVLEEYFMRGERDENAEIALRRAAFLKQEEEEGSRDMSERSRDMYQDDERTDETSILVMTEYFGYDDVLQDFFRSFYCGEITIPREENCFKILLKIACQYEVNWIVRRCLESLDDLLTAENFFRFYRFLMQLGQQEIRDRTLHLLSALDHEDLLNSATTECLSLELDHFLSFLRHAPSPSELLLARLVFLWLEHEPEQRKRKLDTLLASLRMVHLPRSFTYDVIMKYAEAKEVLSKNLLRLILATQSYLMTVGKSTTPLPKHLALFPYIFEARSSYLTGRLKEFELSVPVSELRHGYSEDGVYITTSPDGTMIKVSAARSSSRFLHFVYLKNGEVISRFPVSSFLVPALPEEMERGTLVARQRGESEVDEVEDIIAIEEPLVYITKLQIAPEILIRDQLVTDLDFVLIFVETNLNQTNANQC